MLPPPGSGGVRPWLPEGAGRVDVVADASPCGRLALAWAAELAASYAVDVNVVTCHRLRWYAALLPRAMVESLAAEHELQTLAAAEAELSGRGVRWTFASAGSGPLRRAVRPGPGTVIVPRHRLRCEDTFAALRTVPRPRAAAGELPGHVVVVVGGSAPRVRASAPG